MKKEKKYTTSWFLNFWFIRKFFAKNNFLLKISGQWRRYSIDQFCKKDFNTGEKIEKAEGRYLTDDIRCQNKNCDSLVLLGSKAVTVHVKNGSMRNLDCSCCGKNQYFLLQYPEQPAPCDNKGVKI